ncbi:MAG: hypothetical protein AB3N15_09780 [Paracoccaceae bacterium]
MFSLSIRPINIGRAVIVSFFYVASVYSAAANTACIANYTTDGRVIRSDKEDRLLSALSPDLREVVDLRIKDGFRERGWRSPFGQARYDDMLYMIDFLEKALGPGLTPVHRDAVVAQFTSPVRLRETVEPLSRLIQSDPDRFEALLHHHVGGHKYWQQFSLCAFHSPYAFYNGLHYDTFFESSTGTYADVQAAYLKARSDIPMRNLDGKVLILRRSYLPDKKEPRIRFAAPPCGTDQEPRNMEFKYDVESQAWVRTEPYLPVGTWYLLGFEDPISQGSLGPAANTPREFSEIQNSLAQRFEELQKGVGLPVEFPSDLNLDCGEAE